MRAAKSSSWRRESLCVLCRGGIRQREWRDTHTFGMLRFCWCGGLGFVGVFGLFVWGYVKNQVK